MKNQFYSKQQAHCRPTVPPYWPPLFLTSTPSLNQPLDRCRSDCGAWADVAPTRLKTPPPSPDLKTPCSKDLPPPVLLPHRAGFPPCSLPVHCHPPQFERAFFVVSFVHVSARLWFSVQFSVLSFDAPLRKGTVFHYSIAFGESL
jgi:hypothetical protein